MPYWEIKNKKNLCFNLAYWYPYICLHKTVNKMYNFLNFMYYVKSI